MLIAIVSEMSGSKFQWRDAWSISNQSKYNTYVVPLEFTKNKYLNLPKNHQYWDVLRNADLVLVYATRINDPDETWRWWELPRYVKEFMRPDAKMLCCIDDDWVPMFHPDWGWWQDYPYGSKNPNPKSWFKSTGILDVPDMWLSVLENPEFAKYTSKPTRYLPLPQLNRYPAEISYATSEYTAKGLHRMHGNAIGILRHSSKVGSVQHLIKNVIDKTDKPVVYFSCEYSNPTPLESKNPITIYGYMGRKKYMATLCRDCKVAIDDAENYIGWSRFTMEAAINYIPCVGSNKSAKEIYPDLYVEHGNYDKQVELVNKLFSDQDFYTKMVEQGRANLRKLSDEAFCENILDIAKEIGCVSSDANIRLQLFLQVLSEFLPWEKIPPRPVEKHSVVYDRMHKKSINQTEWDMYYSGFTEFMKDEKTYGKYIRYVNDMKDKNRNTATNLFFRGDISECR